MLLLFLLWLFLLLFSCWFCCYGYLCRVYSNSKKFDKNKCKITPFSLFGLFWPHLIPFGPVWLCLPLLGPFWSSLTCSGSAWPKLSCLALSNLVWPHLAHSTLLDPAWSSLALSGLFGSICLCTPSLNRKIYMQNVWVNICTWFQDFINSEPPRRPRSLSKFCGGGCDQPQASV